jgi:putative GTP pyrophosphokinase
MDFWASLEHKIYYKYRDNVPQELLDGLKDAADTAARLDKDMERLHQQVRGLHPSADAVEAPERALAQLLQFRDSL